MAERWTHLAISPDRLSACLGFGQLGHNGPARGRRRPAARLQRPAQVIRAEPPAVLRRLSKWQSLMANAARSSVGIAA